MRYTSAKARGKYRGASTRQVAARTRRIVRTILQERALLTDALAKTDQQRKAFSPIYPGATLRQIVGQILGLLELQHVMLVRLIREHPRMSRVLSGI